MKKRYYKEHALDSIEYIRNLNLFWRNESLTTIDINLSVSLYIFVHTEIMK